MGCAASVAKKTAKDRGKGNLQAPETIIEARVACLEEQLHRQATQLQEMAQAMACVQRDCTRTVSVLQYNILASYLGRNTQPWFLYGADCRPEEREQIFAKFYERDATGTPKNSWPAYVESILTPAQVQEVARRDEAFRWENRKVRLLEEIRKHNADVISLVELDHPDYFAECLENEWDMVFHKRPRPSSKDGCGVFWRRSKFSKVAEQGFDFVDGSDDKGRAKRDRCCLMVLLEFRCLSAPPLVVVSTHLAKDPDDRSQTAIRVRQVTQIMENLTEFTEQHGAEDAPVVLCGDLNARHFGEIRGIACTVFQFTGNQLHKFLWCATDVPTGPTSITEARMCRIDAVQFLSSQLEVLEVKPMPKLRQGQVIPCDVHPSDHFPVFVRFRLKDGYQKQREVARAWLECVAGHEKLNPLTELELQEAFDFFDRDKDLIIHRHDLAEACFDLQSNFQVDVQRLLLDCFPDKQISYDNFIRAYEARLNHERIRSVGELEYAFEYFAGGKHIINVHQLEAIFREITPISFSDEEVKEMIARLNMPPGEDSVDVKRFCEVVCKATFPRKDRRKFSRRSVVDNAGEFSKNRSQTKEICSRLEQMDESLTAKSMPRLVAKPHRAGVSNALLGVTGQPTALEPIPASPTAAEGRRSPNVVEDNLQSYSTPLKLARVA